MRPSLQRGGREARLYCIGSGLALFPRGNFPTYGIPADKTVKKSYVPSNPITWNCRHLANGQLADIIDDTCIETGFTAPRILTPQQLMEKP